MSTPSKTTGPKKATAKPATRKTSKVKTAETAASSKPPTSPLSGSASPSQAAQPTVVNAPTPMIAGTEMRKKELIEQVVMRSGMKKRDVKPLVDTLFAVMGEAVAEGRELIIPPFGRLKVHKQKITPKKKIFFAKVHQNIASASGLSTVTDESDI